MPKQKLEPDFDSTKTDRAFSARIIGIIACALKSCRWPGGFHGPALAMAALCRVALNRANAADRVAPEFVRREMGLGRAWT